MTTAATSKWSAKSRIRGLIDLELYDFRHVMLQKSLARTDPIPSSLRDKLRIGKSVQCGTYPLREHKPLWLQRCAACSTEEKVP